MPDDSNNRTCFTSVLTMDEFVPMQCYEQATEIVVCCITLLAAFFSFLLTMRP